MSDALRHQKTLRLASQRRCGPPRAPESCWFPALGHVRFASRRDAFQTGGPCGARLLAAHAAVKVEL
jgi:hypothetical protein